MPRVLTSNRFDATPHLDCGGQLLVTDWTGSDSSTVNSVLALHGDYAYIVTAAFASGGSFTENARLFVVDISDPTAPTNVTTVDLGDTWMKPNVRVSSDGSMLWVSGHIYTSPSTDSGFKAVARYDLSTPSSPVFDDSGAFDLESTWGLFEQSGTVYIFGTFRTNEAFPGTGVRFDYALVLGSDFSTVSTYLVGAPGNFDADQVLLTDPLLYTEPLQIGDTIPVLATTAYLTTKIYALDFTTPASPFAAWVSGITDVYPRVRLNSTNFYAQKDGTTYEFDGSGTATAATGSYIFSSPGYYLRDGTRIYQAALPGTFGAGYNASYFSLYSCFSSLRLRRWDAKTCGDDVDNLSASKFGDVWVDGATVVLAAVGYTASGITLTTATGVAG